MPNETVTINKTGDSNAPTEAQTEVIITLSSVVLLGLAAVGGYVVAKKLVMEVRANRKMNREYKNLLKEHKKVKPA